ncbi:hypothetical protein J6590_031274 [Homalodisca vitripennis]|nr:hypothetical protein J6590_031274 [Homalodisca vitripennis]
MFYFGVGGSNVDTMHGVHFDVFLANFVMSSDGRGTQIPGDESVSDFRRCTSRLGDEMGEETVPAMRHPLPLSVESLILLLRCNKCVISP